MTEITIKYAGFEGLREQVVALRREGFGLRRIRDRLHLHNNNILGRPVIHVAKSADLYRRVEGTWYGIVLGAGPANRHNVRFDRHCSPMV
ncbi:hypothetical protein [Streptomyces sp. Ncost-T10-10d]|uniref:hypothetical protein n=1 Tax=Streptomyces sp. Ncost-T10-10d TaxID=1839774 RepID=UPI000B80BF45|nr:hypothetical protein [Streptomyces sp. Ncost-T10-10d]